MNGRLILFSLAFAVTPVQALDAARLMPELTWEQRVLIVFSPHSRHAEYRQQIDLLERVEVGLHERDITLIEAFADDRVIVDGRQQVPGGSSFYRHFSIDSDEFRVVLVGKDGTVKLDRAAVVASADLFSLIDAMPMRRLEMQQKQ